MKKFLETYTNLHAGNLEELHSVYTDDIHFIDPAHEIYGIDNLTAYFGKLYENISTIEFHFAKEISLGDKGYIQWLMTFSHPRIKGGDTITVPGTSYLEFTGGKVHFHRDYFDLGGMLYEHIPLLGRVITTIKGRLAS